MNKSKLQANAPSMYFQLEILSAATFLLLSMFNKISCLGEGESSKSEAFILNPSIPYSFAASKRVLV